MYYIVYRLDNLKVAHYDKIKKPQLDIYGIAEYNGEIPKNDWLTVDNLRKEIETWTEKELNELGKEVEVEYSKEHIVCDLVPHFYPKKEPSEKQKAQARIKVLKEELSNTDYQAIKFAEGWLSEEEYAPIKAQRQAYREEINRLEMLL